MMNWINFTPELHFSAASAVFFLFTLGRRPEASFCRNVAAVLSLVGTGICLAGTGLSGELFAGTYRVDLFSQLFKVMLSGGLFLVICLCGSISEIEERLHPEFYLLLFICTLSMMMLVSAVHLLTLYVTLELSSYCLYILVFLSRSRWGVNAGLRYFLTGAVSSAVMLFGMALFYGATGEVLLPRISVLLPEISTHPEAALGLLLTLCGLFFKLALFPFHIWAPDAYQGAASQVTAYIATASKVAAAGILIRVISAAPESRFLLHALVILSITSMTLGNLSAMVQKDLKRLLAWSSIAHAGYVLLGILCMTPEGYAGSMFYALSILVMKYTVFLVLVMVAADRRTIGIGDLAGLHKRSPLLAVALMLSLFSLAGIPPTIGFTGKLLIFAAAVEKGLFVLVVIAMVNVVISLYYYLLVLKAAYLAEPDGEDGAIFLSLPKRIVTVSCIVFLTAAGMFPNLLIEFAQSAVRAF